MENPFLLCHHDKGSNCYEFNRSLKSWNFVMNLSRSNPYFCFEVYAFQKIDNKFQCIDKISSPNFLVISSKRKSLKIKQSKSDILDNWSFPISKDDCFSYNEKRNSLPLLNRKPKSIDDNYYILDVDTYVNNDNCRVSYNVVDVIEATSDREEISSYGEIIDDVKNIFIRNDYYIDRFGNIIRTNVNK